MTIETWKYQDVCYRIFYQGKRDSLEGQNILQQKRSRVWQTIETEDVPAYTRLAKACFGDIGGWKSLLVEKTYTHYGRKRF